MIMRMTTTCMIIAMTTPEAVASSSEEPAWTTGVWAGNVISGCAVAGALTGRAASEVPAQAAAVARPYVRAGRDRYPTQDALSTLSRASSLATPADF